jgi:arylsulfatase A-like enzyme
LLVFILVLVTANIAASSWLVDTGSHPARPRNVLLVAIDLLDARSAWPFRDTTPELRRLMREGTSFTDARAQSNLTTPCSRILLRGRNLSRLAGAPSLATLLGRRGYDTGGFASSFFCYDAYIADGFQTYACPSPLEGGRPGDDTVERARAWIAARGARPWFCWVMLWDLHMSPAGRPLGGGNRQRLDRAIAYDDACVGRLLQSVSDDTLVVVVGLHGVMELDNPLSDSLLRVPFVIRAPGVPEARRVPGPVAQIDVVPTILGCLGFPGYQGDGLDVIASPPPGLRDVVVETDGREATAVIRDGWKYASYRHNLDLPVRRGESVAGPPDPRRPGWSIIAEAGRRDLFDLRRHPLERTNLVTRFPRVASDLAKRLSRWHAGAGATAATPLSPALEKALRTHGYLPR